MRKSLYPVLPILLIVLLLISGCMGRGHSSSDEWPNYYLFAMSNNHILAYKILADGTLPSSPTYSLLVGSTSNHCMDVDPKGRYVYYSIDYNFHAITFNSTTGFGLTPYNYSFSNTKNISAIACDPDRPICLIGYGNNIFRFDGSLVSDTNQIGLTPITSIVFNRTNSFVYMSGTTGPNFKIYQFSYPMGSLNQQPSLSLYGCDNLVIDPTDKNLYGNSSNKVFHVYINSDGTLSNEQGDDAQGNLALICGITVDQYQHVYVTNSGGTGYQAFSLIFQDPNFQVKSQSSSFSGYPSGIACVPNGKYVYVPQGSTGIQIFDSTNGFLTPKSFVSLSDGQPFIVKIVDVVQ